MKLREWILDHKKALVTAVLLGLLPLVLSVVYCALYGRTIGQVFLPGSYWNDELFYYKQVEGILKQGAPAGYFGFNESRGRYLSFAAWSPALLLQWCIWGFLFGWNYLSPVLCNIFCMMAGMAVFAWLARPGKRQAVAVALLFSLFTPFTRFTLSATAEAPCLSLLLVYMGLVFRYRDQRKNGSLWGMMLLAGLLTLMRPYFALLLLYPAWYYGRQGKKKCVTALLVSGAFLVGYGALKYLFSADYLQDLFDVSFFTTFFTEGIGAGVSNLFTLAIDGLKIIVLSYLKLALKHGHFAGSLYAVFGFLWILLMFVVFWEQKRRKERGNFFWIAVSLAAALVVMMAAILFMYKTSEGSRHLFGFILMGILVLGMYSPKKAVFLQTAFACVICYFFVLKAGTPYDYQLSMDDGILSAEIKSLADGLNEKMELQKGRSWANTVIWLSYDLVDGETVAEQWQQLYAVPAGFGINFCPRDYVYDRLSEVKSRYIAAIPGGDVERQLVEAGAEYLAGNEKVAVYDLALPGKFR